MYLIHSRLGQGTINLLLTNNVIARLGFREASVNKDCCMHLNTTADYEGPRSINRAGQILPEADLE